MVDQTHFLSEENLRSRIRIASHQLRMLTICQNEAVGMTVE